MRKLTRKQILAHLFVGFFTLGSLFFTVNSAVANTVKIENENNYSASIIAGGNYNAGDVESNSVEIINSNINSGQIFGGRRSGGGGLVSSNTVTISDNSTVSDLVYGGNAFGEGADGRVEYNKVVITESYLGKSAYGGKVNVKGSATGNSVDVSENSVITENVYGAEVWSSGDAVSNKADIASSTVKNSVYGGWVGSGSATKNEVHIASSTVTGSVYGGNVDETGSATQNIVDIVSSTIGGKVCCSYVGGTGSATQNIVTIASSTTKTVYGGYVSTGNANQNEVHIVSSTVGGELCCSYVGDTGSATQNVVDISSSTINAVYGSNVSTGNALENEVHIASSTIKGIVYGGKSSNGNADSNKVKIASSTVGGVVYGSSVTTGSATQNVVDISSSTINAVYGAKISNGNADSNEVKITNSSVAGTVNVTYVSGGYVGNTGSATLNIVDIASSTIKNGSVYGGYVGSGSATQNIVDIASSTINGGVWGGYVKGTGSATENKVAIANSTVDGSVFGGYVYSGSANQNIVNIASSTAADVHGGCVEVSGNATQNIVDIAGSTVNSSVYGGRVDGTGSATQNIVNITSGSKVTGVIFGGRVNNGDAEYNTVAISDDNTTTGMVYGGSVSNTGSATQNIVNVALGSTVGGIYGGYVKNGGNATDNTVEISDGSTVELYVYGGFVDKNGDATNNTVKLSGGSTVKGDVYGGNVNGTGDAVTGNKLIISGTDNKIGGIAKNFESVSFKLASDDDTSKSMLSVLSLDAAMDLNQVKLDTELPESGLNGEITLVDGKISAENAVYTINGTAVDGDKSLTFAQKNDSGVNVGFYKYVLSESAIKLNAESTIAAAFQQSGKDPLSTDDRKIVVTSEMANKYSRIYGAFNADGKAATNATVELSEAVSNENLTIYGGYSTGSGVDVITGNTLKVLKNGNKIKDILNFSNLDFSLDSDNGNNPTMLAIAADTVDLSKASININLTNALAEGQTVTLLGAAQQLSLANDKLTINNEKLDSDLSLKIVDDSSKKYVNVGGYSLNNASGKLSITADESFITSKYINGDKSKSVEKIDLTNDLSGFKNIYGSYSADNSVAEGGIISINEKVDLSQTTLIGGKATDNGTVGKNTLEISSAAAGSKVNGVSKFSDVNVKLDNAIAEGQTVTLLEANNLELTDSVFTINNKTLDSNLSLKFADDSTKKYVSIGEYNLKNSDNKLSISAKESLLTSRYRNGAEDLSVEKFELTKDLNKFKNIYGSYSADNSAAEGGKLSINEKVDLSQTALIGGYSASNGEVKNNTLEISSAAVGSKVKGVEKFDNIKFVLASDVSGNTPILSTTDKVVLEGATINTDLSGFTASDNTSLILLDNTEGKAAKRLINGTEGEVFNAKYNGSFVAINSIGYSSDEDKVAIDVKNAGAGAFIDKDGNLIGKMELTLGDSTASNVRANVRAGSLRASEGSDLSGYEDIYGIYSAGEIDPAGPVTVNIVSAIDYSNTVLHGGYKNGNRYAKNTNLIIDSLNVKLKGVTDFESMTFNLPAETKNGDTMLKVADEVDMEPTKSVGVEVSKATGLKAGDSVNLIDSDVGIKNFGTQKVTVSGLTDKTGEVKVDDKALVLDINDEKPNKNTKAPVEAVSATMALVNQASALASSKLNKSMIAAVASANGGSATFASMNGGHSKYETGSYVEADSWNIGFGIAKKGMSSKNPDSTYGLFFQYGKSNFDTHNDGGFRGDGDSKMFGAGLTFHQEARSKFYYHGNIYAGKVDAKWNCSEGGYDDNAAYWGMTFGMGRKHNAGGNKTMDVYGRYSFNHVGSMDGKIGGNEYCFDSTTSHNLRLGLRMEYAQKNAATAYWGLAWEHEFAGDSKATVVKLGRTDSPTLNGNTGIAEVGYEWKRGNWEYNINAEGSFGKRKGVTGSFNINYNF